MPQRDVTLVALFMAGALSLLVLLAAFLGALIVSQRRRIALERAHSQRILAAQEEERSRVARELHDDALQRLAVIRHELDEAGRRFGPEMIHHLHGVVGEVQDLADVLRTAAHQLHPSVVEKAGLVRALGELAGEIGRTAGLDVSLALPPSDLVVSPAVGVALYRIAQEALRNVARHAEVHHADLVLELADGSLCLRIADSGKGFVPGHAPREHGLGLVAMRQRAEALGGRVTVTAQAGGGTVVSATIPSPEAT